MASPGSSSANPAAFSKRGTFALVAFGIVAFVAFLFLIGQGGMSGSANNGRAHAASTGLTGFAALTRMLEADGMSIERSRDRGALDAPGLLVLTPPGEVHTEELADIVEARRTVGPTMVIAPKWFAMPASGDDARQGWVHVLGASDGWELELDGAELALGIDENRARASRWQGTGDLRGSLPSRRATMHLDPEGADGPIDALVTDGEGRILAGYLRDDGSFLDGDLYLDPGRGDGVPVFGVMLVAEPDLMNNWGLADRNRAMQARELIDIARQGTEAPVRFDLTTNGIGASRNLLTLAFEPPFLAATLTLLLALAIAFWRAFARFGPALRPAPAIQPGKGQLVTNGAQVIARSGRLNLVRDPYADLVGRRIARRLGLGDRGDMPVEAALRERDHTDVAQAMEDLRDARGTKQTLRAARALRDLERTL